MASMTLTWFSQLTCSQFSDGSICRSPCCGLSYRISWYPGVMDGSGNSTRPHSQDGRGCTLPRRTRNVDGGASTYHQRLFGSAGLRQLEKSQHPFLLKHHGTSCRHPSEAAEGKKTNLGYSGLSVGAPRAPFFALCHFKSTCADTTWLPWLTLISLTSFSFPPSSHVLPSPRAAPSRLSYQGKRASPLRFLLFP